MSFTAGALPDPSVVVAQVNTLTSVPTAGSLELEPVGSMSPLLAPTTHAELVSAVISTTQAELAEDMCRARREQTAAEAADADEARSLLTGVAGTLGLEKDETVSDALSGAVGDILGFDLDSDEGLLTQLGGQIQQELNRFADPFAAWSPDKNLSPFQNAATQFTSPLTTRSAFPSQSECDLSLFGGTVQTLGATATLAYRDLVVGARNATLGVVQSVRTVANMAGALANVGWVELGTRIASRAIVLRAIQTKLGSVKKLVQRLEALGADGYGQSNEDVINAARNLLEISESNVTGLENVALRGGEVNADALNTEEERIEQAAELLVSIDEGLLPSAKGAGLRARLMVEKTLLQGLTNDMQQTHNAMAAVYQNLANFNSNLTAVAGQKSPNLVAPVLRQIRCRLEKVTDDMDATLRSNNILGVYIKRIQWFVELEALLLVVRTSKQLLENNPNPSFSITTKVSAAIAGLQSALTDAADTGLSEQKVGQLLLSLVSLDRRLASKIIKRSQNDGIISLCDTGIELVDQIIAGSDGLTQEVDEIWGKNSDLQTDFAAAAVAVANYLAFADKSNLNNITKSFRELDFAGMFGMGPEAASRVYQGETLTARLLEECRRDPQASPRTIQDLVNLRIFYSDKRDEEEVERVYFGKVADKVKREIEAIDIAEPNELLPALRRLQRDPCVGAAAVGTPLPQTVPTVCDRSVVFPVAGLGLSSSEVADLTTGG